MRSKLTVFLVKYQKLIPLVLLVVFFAVTIPGISWGAPDLWNPDELYWRVGKALHGELKFDETEPDYNYPSLPKYVMYGAAWLVRAAGGSDTAMLVSARLISVLLGGLTVLLVYFIVKLLTRNVYIPILAALLVLSDAILAHNARFAHNDLYLLFFVTLTLFALVKYRLAGNRLWLYLAFFAVGCAASSKYTGAMMLVVALLAFLIANWKTLFQDWLRIFETAFISAALTVAGFVVGTPKALTWMAYYFKRMIPAALRFASYGRGPDSLPGLYGQWGTFRSGVGTAVYYLFLIAFVWFLIKLVLHLIGKVRPSRILHEEIQILGASTLIPKEPKLQEEDRQKAILVILSAIVLFDLPFLASYNYVPRFFLPFVPMFAILASLFVEDMLQLFQRQNHPFAASILNAVVIVVIAVSFLNIISVALLFANDARSPAGQFIATLSPDSTVEYTLYPPHISKDNFYKARNYPIYLVKYPGEVAPEKSKSFEYNQGEAGLYERGVDYLVVDSFTYSRFSNEHICSTNPVECDFFTRLLAGNTSLRLLASFEYSLPSYLPQIGLASVNPVVKVYEVPR